MALHRSLERLERPEALRAFLLGTAFRLTAFELRTRSRRRRRLCLTSTGALPDVALEPPHRERDALRALDRVLSALEPEAREAFVLRHVEDAKAEEVATHLGVTPSKAKRLLARASSRVRLLAGRDAALAGYTAHARNLA